MANTTDMDYSDAVTVRVSFTVKVSRSAWSANYGIEGTNAIKQDAKQHIENGVIDHLGSLGLLAK